MMDGWVRCVYIRTQTQWNTSQPLPKNEILVIRTSMDLEVLSEISQKRETNNV